MPEPMPTTPEPSAATCPKCPRCGMPESFGHPRLHDPLGTVHPCGSHEWEHDGVACFDQTTLCMVNERDLLQRNLLAQVNAPNVELQTAERIAGERDALAAQVAALRADVARLEGERTKEMPITIAQRACELVCYVTRQWAKKAGYDRPTTILEEEGRHVIPLRRFTDGPDTRIWVELIDEAFRLAQREYDSTQEKCDDPAT